MPEPTARGRSPQARTVDKPNTISVQPCAQPDMVIYNAGTDILDGDPLGHMRVSAEGVAARDEAVFEVIMRSARLHACRGSDARPANTWSMQHVWRACSKCAK